METVAGVLAAHSRYLGSMRIFCDEGATDAVDLPLHRLPAGLDKRARIEAVAAALKAYGADCVEYHQQIGNAAAIARRLPRARHILYRHNAIEPGGSLIDRMRYGWRYAAFDRIVFVSEAARAEFAGSHPRFADRTRAIRNAIDPAGWLADPDLKEPLIAFSGRAMKEKGVDLLCEALIAVLTRHPGWRAALALGDWDKHDAWAAPHVDRLVEAVGERVDVRRSAPLGEVANILRRAAIAVVPSVWAEPLGLTALEAHVAGAAVVSSGRGGLKEASGPHAVYVDDLTARGLAEAIERLIEDPTSRLALARDGQAYALAQHSPAARAAELDALRDEVMSAPPARRR